MQRVVITGLGMINSLGHNVEESFKAIVDGQTGIDYYTI
jgi:3-oxoacyl-[acyl-carrier-protein] synthase II